MKTLVIGYGNELRQDDGIGPRVARIVAGWQKPGIEGIPVHQLTPELAERVSQAERVVFVDAGTGTALTVKLLESASTTSTWGHACDPQSLLALAEAVYGRRPEAWLVEVPAGSLGFGEELSSLAERGLELAMEQIRRLVDLPVPIGNGRSAQCTRSV